ncbi:FxLYD domain-containing protein [Cytophagaceae bacterium DM2B3-1]|uniref:FxLYD domain-containing protein n=1 Tax=Xanthocytophaga flava TaxID=3048013 RepID=A0ABT7CRI8_9BACT|nr:FxLYD domain-containing protein [Xanthocytophaga flavus]MDJ1468584.1 FxLYD domain-containing protein [Xanthocytophaga flavus]MDJ1496364.1 FxLYD domain-containing protein [Xanthocytophaga flavus]
MRSLFSIPFLVVSTLSVFESPSVSPVAEKQPISVSGNITSIKHESGLPQLPVKIHYTFTSDGFVHATGIVTNTTGHWLSNVFLRIDIVDAQGKKLKVRNLVEENFKSGASDDFSLAISCIPPNAEVPFEYLRDMKRIEGVYNKLTLKAEGVIVNGGGTELSITQTESKKEYGAIISRGTVALESGSCHTPGVVAVGYDKMGKVQKVTSNVVYKNNDGNAMGESFTDFSVGDKGYFKITLRPSYNTKGKPVGELQTVKLFSTCKCQ